MAHTSHILWEPDRLEPFPRIRLGVIKVCADVSHGLVRVSFEVRDAPVDALEHGAQSLVPRVPRHDLPRAPRRVDLADALDRPVVVVPLRREMLPHEEVGRAVVDAVAEPGERLQRDDVEGRVPRGRQPAFRVREHEPHYIGAARCRRVVSTSPSFASSRRAMGTPGRLTFRSC